MDGGVEVADAEITSLLLSGYSLAGPVTVNESASMASTGEVRSMQAGQQFPASSFFDIYATVMAPSSPVGLVTVHNVVPLRITALDDITSWPPYGARFKLNTPYNVDDDHDGQIDEDGPDDDGDGLIDEDRPGPDPNTPPNGCGNDPDCDHREGDDPPIELCPPATPGVHTLCDNDSDGQIDEDPSCIPLFSDAGLSMPLGVCLREATITLVDPASITPIPSPTVNPTATYTPRPRTPTATRTPTVTPTATPVLTGDANCSGRVDAIDSALILQMVAGLLGSLPCGQAADANVDGRVNAIDSALILQFVVRLLGSLPP
jgi:hypothetical protein